MKKLRIIFMGTPAFGVPILEELIKSYEVIAVVCQPDRGVLSPIKKLAIENKIEVYQPEKIKEEFDFIIKLKPDLIVTCAFGQIINWDIIKAPKYGCINVHASLLPKLRGGAPIHRAIINGDYKTGITIMKTVERLDAGPILTQREINIEETDNVGTLHNKLSILGKELLMETIPLLVEGKITPKIQEESSATFASNIKREDEKIDFSKSSRQVFNLIRGLNPFPGAYTILETKIIKVWNSRIGTNFYFDKHYGEIVAIYDDGIGVKTENGEIIITELQMEGKTRMFAKDFLNGLRDPKLLIGKLFD
jgi:methionyl-tRNA formyltransferase